MCCEVFQKRIMIYGIEQWERRVMCKICADCTSRRLRAWRTNELPAPASRLSLHKLETRAQARRRVGRCLLQRWLRGAPERKEIPQQTCPLAREKRRAHASRWKASAPDNTGHRFRSSKHPLLAQGRRVSREKPRQSRTSHAPECEIEWCANRCLPMRRLMHSMSPLFFFFLVVIKCSTDRLSDQGSNQ